MKKNDKRKIRIWKKTFALALSSVMIFSCIPMTQVKAGDESPEAIINGLVDLPKTFIDKDSQDLGSDRVFYRNTNTDLSMLPAECYKKALQSYIIDDDVPMGTRKGDYLLSDWDYLGWILSVEKGQGNYGYLNDTLCNMTIYGNRRKSELKLDDAWYNWGGYFSESSLANAQQHIANDLTRTPLGSLPLKKLDSISNDTEESPVVVRWHGALRAKDSDIAGRYKAYAVYFHNFRVSPIFPMYDNSYKRVISDEKKTSNIYSSDIRNNSGVEVSGTQSLTNSTTYGALSSISGSKSYTYEESVTVTHSKSLPFFGDLETSIGFSASQSIEKGWSKEESEERSTENTSEVSLSLLPYTAALIQQQTKTQTATTYYKCPVYINYDVTIVEYDRNLRGGKLNSYVLASFTGAGSQNARTNLKKRSYIQASMTDPDGINWGTVKKYKYGDELLKRIRRNGLMSAAGGSYTETLSSVSSKVDDLIPTLPLSDISVKSGAPKSVNIKQHYSLSKIKLVATNTKGADYYGFNAKKGIWKITNAKGTPVKSSTATLSGNAGKQVLTGKKKGTLYLTYFINDNTYSTADYIEKYSTNNSVDRPTLRISITGNTAPKISGNTTYKPSKKASGTVTIPTYVKRDGKTYRVTKIASNAFKGNTKVKKIVIPSTVTNIGKKAFYGCKNLKAVTIKTSQLTTARVGSQAFTKTHAKAIITVPKGKVKSYKKIFLKKGLSKNATVK